MSKKDKEGKFVPSGHVGSGEVATVDVTMRSHHGLPSAGGAGAAASTASESANYTATGYVPGTLQGATFVHPPDRLVRGRVIYKAKYLGHLKVSQPQGSAIVKDAIDKLKLVALVHNTNEAGSGSTDVDISISVRAVTCTQRGTKDILHQHPLHLISYSADDKRAASDDNVVCYIAKQSPKSEQNVCFVYETLQHQAQEVTATIGQAFELAWRRFQDTKAKTKDTVKDLRKKITDDKQKESLVQHLLLLQAHEKIPAGYKQPSTINQEAAAAFEDMTPEQRKELEELMAEARKVEMHDEAAKAKLTKQASAILQWTSLTEALPAPVAQEEQLSDLDRAIFDIEDQIKELEDVFGQRQRLEVGEVEDVEPPSSQEEEEEDDISKKMMADIEEKLKEIQASNDDIDLPELPANFVMDEFMKAREQAKMPKKGTVKQAAGDWVKMTENY